MDNPSTYYIDLITRYLAGEAVGDDLVFLAEWLKADPEHRKIFDDYRRTWLVFEKSRVEMETDLDKEWETIQGRIRDEEIPVAGLHLSGEENTTFSVLRYLTPYKVMRLAALMLLIAVPVFFLYRYMASAKPERFLANTDILKGKLPDGTSVTLNTGSVLEYPAAFRGGKRTVKLAGEAWFEVKHENTKPFIISSRNIIVEVLGTSFYVNTNSPDGNVEVILNSGSVAVYYADRPENRVLLTPGQKAEVSVAKSDIVKGVNGDQNYLSWMTKKFIYKNDPLSEIVTGLNKAYHVNIRIASPAISHCLVTATFDNQSLESVLKVLQATLDLRINVNGAWTNISGNQCK